MYDNEITTESGIIYNKALKYLLDSTGVYLQYFLKIISIGIFLYHILRVIDKGNVTSFIAVLVLYVIAIVSLKKRRGGVKLSYALYYAAFSDAFVVLADLLLSRILSNTVKSPFVPLSFYPMIGDFFAENISQVIFLVIAFSIVLGILSYFKIYFYNSLTQYGFFRNTGTGEPEQKRMFIALFLSVLISGFVVSYFFGDMLFELSRGIIGGLGEIEYAVILVPVWYYITWTIKGCPIVEDNKTVLAKLNFNS